jgi:hypothetical protein
MAIKTLTCNIAVCDDCGDEYENDYIPHWPSGGEAIDDAVGGGEWWSKDDALLCSACKLKPHPFTPDDVVADCGRCDAAQEDHDEVAAVSA